MASFKHDVLKNALNVFSLPMYWRLPPIKHLRSILEASTMLSTLPWGITFEKHDFDDFKAECLTPIGSDSEKVILYLHGGGYVMGSPHTHRALAGKISKGTELNSLVIDYRKAPENPYPAALDDAIAAYMYLIERRNYQPENIVLVGDSAGGGLAVALQYALRDFQLPLPKASVLLSPYVDLTQKGKSIKNNSKNDRFLDVFEMRKWAKLYAGYHDMKNPYVSPLYGDLKGLPPMLVQASKSEVLYDDARRLVVKARKAGIDVEFQVWNGLIHWWHMFGTMPESKEAIDKVVDFINLQYANSNISKKTA